MSDDKQGSSGGVQIATCEVRERASDVEGRLDLWFSRWLSGTAGHPERESWPFYPVLVGAWFLTKVVFLFAGVFGVIRSVFLSLLALFVLGSCGSTISDLLEAPTRYRELEAIPFAARAEIRQSDARFCRFGTKALRTSPDSDISRHVGARYRLELPARPSSSEMTLDVQLRSKGAMGQTLTRSSAVWIIAGGVPLRLELQSVPKGASGRQELFRLTFEARSASSIDLYVVPGSDVDEDDWKESFCPMGGCAELLVGFSAAFDGRKIAARFMQDVAAWLDVIERGLHDQDRRLSPPPKLPSLKRLARELETSHGCSWNNFSDFRQRSVAVLDGLVRAHAYLYGPRMDASEAEALLKGAKETVEAWSSLSHEVLALDDDLDRLARNHRLGFVNVRDLLSLESTDTAYPAIRSAMHLLVQLAQLPEPGQRDRALFWARLFLSPDMERYRSWFADAPRITDFADATARLATTEDFLDAQDIITLPVLDVDLFLGNREDRPSFDQDLICYGSPASLIPTPDWRQAERLVRGTLNLGGSAPLRIDWEVPEPDWDKIGRYLCDIETDTSGIEARLNASSARLIDLRADLVELEARYGYRSAPPSGAAGADREPGERRSAWFRRRVVLEVARHADGALCQAFAPSRLNRLYGNLSSSATFLRGGGDILTLASSGSPLACSHGPLTEASINAQNQQRLNHWFNRKSSWGAGDLNARAKRAWRLLDCDETWEKADLQSAVTACLSVSLSPKLGDAFEARCGAELVEENNRLRSRYPGWYNGPFLVHEARSVILDGTGAPITVAPMPPLLNHFEFEVHCMRHFDLPLDRLERSGPILTVESPHPFEVEGVRSRLVDGLQHVRLVPSGSVRIKVDRNRQVFVLSTEKRRVAY